MFTKDQFKPTGLDRLESREVLSAGSFGFLHEMIALRHATDVAPVMHQPISTPRVTVKPLLGGGPDDITMPNVSQDLNAVYHAFQANGGDTAALASNFPMIRFQGNTVGVNIKGKGDLNIFVGELKSLGVTITKSSAAYNVVVGYVPVAELPTLSTLPQTASVSPNYRAVLGRA